MSYPPGPPDPYAQGPYQRPPEPPPGPWPYPVAGGPTGSAPRGSRRALWLAAVAGFLVAVVVTVILVATDALPGTSGDDVSSDSVTLPAKVDDFVRFDKLAINQRAAAKRSVAHTELVDRKTAESLRSSHDGAGAAVTTYADEKLENVVMVWAVRGHTPPPVVPYQDADYLGLAQPQQVVRKIGRTYCSLTSLQAYTKGQKPSSDSYFAVLCQRSEGALTVTIIGSTGGDFTRNPPRVAAAVDEVWNGLT